MFRPEGQAAKMILAKLKSLLQERYTTLAVRVQSIVQGQSTSAGGAAVNAKLESAREWYEQFTGIDEVRRAQEKVVQSESKFISAQEARRDANKKLSEVDNKLRQVYGELERTRRGEDRYIFLVTQENTLIKERDILGTHFQRIEQEERENFSSLSSAIKESHEKERLQAERTKYWSIIASIVCTSLGFIFSTVNSRYRMNQFRSILSDAVTNEEKLALVVSDKLAEKVVKELQMQSSVAGKVTEKPTDTLSKEELRSFYQGLLSSLEKERVDRENFVIRIAMSTGAAFIIYKLFF
ncbi:mitochondrial potassium channel-like [Neocloeon triangulifer]|uniref:mitochondrial potassium channel-like n=1 Tax=Neocloeon triangulifer TaxID=2078957 RepID=UPI00286F79E0|nr:mitochondrial potassium channel-like [Neocloeon triangulifer]